MGRHLLGFRKAAVVAVRNNGLLFFDRIIKGRFLSAFFIARHCTSLHVIARHCEERSNLGFIICGTTARMQEVEQCTELLPSGYSPQGE